MFPNLRLLVVAVLAAIAGIGCGLGLFATFRVNHEPLMRFSEGGPPLQLAFDNRTAIPEAASPIPARLPLDGGRLASAPLLIPAPPVEETPTDAGPAAPPEQGREPSGSADAPSEAPIASATPVDTSSPAVDDDKPVQGEAEIVAMTEPVEPASNGAAASAGSEPVVEKNVPSVADEQQAPAKPSKAPETKQESTVKTPAKAARTTAPVRRPAKVVRRRVPATVAAQPADQFAQPNYQQPAQASYQAYQWTDPNAQARPAVRRVFVKRHQAVKRPVPAAQSNLAGATAGVTGPE